jgi:hypothetical protein
MIYGYTRRVWRMVLAVTVVGVPLAVSLVRADNSQVASPTWANPAATTVKKVGQTSAALLNATAYNGNIDCAPGATQLPASQSFRNACWMSTAFGLYDPGNSLIANLDGANRAAPLVPYGSSDTILPWSNSLDALNFTSSDYGGANVSLYKDLPNVMRSDYAALGSSNKVDERVTQPADMNITDYDGQTLRINPSSLAFSSSGSWLVVEAMNGAFARYNLATLNETRFAPSFQRVGVAGTSESEVAISNDGRYAAIFNNAADSLKVYDLTTCTAATDNQNYLSCPSHDYWSLINSQISGLSFINRIRFMNDGLLSFQATSNGISYDYELAPRAGISSLIDYLGLGDSYTSGEGAYNYEAGTDTGLDVCHLSLVSYPLLLSHDIFTSDSGHSVACSGAKIQDIMPKSINNYYGQVANGEPVSARDDNDIAQILASYLPGYLPQDAFVSQYQPGAVTVSVGGDDIGFSQIVETCAEPHVSLHISDQTCYNTYEDRLEILNRIDSTVPHWTALYQHLLASDPGVRLYAVGYPQVAVDDGNCADNVHLNTSEIEFTEELVNYLNGAIAQAAAAANVDYVDVGQALAGHRLCEAKSYDIAVNGLTAGTGIKVLGDPVLAKESYHPNALGQELLEQAILKATDNLAKPMPSVTTTPPATDGTTILNVPKSGRPVYQTSIDTSITQPSAGLGKAITVTVGGIDHGLVPGNPYTIHIGGSDGTVIGTLTGGDDGNLSGSVTVPEGSDSGSQTIDVTGTDQDGTPIDVSTPIYVPVTNTDSDGDGIPDSADTCPNTPNSGRDVDGDGIDDACEAVIGKPVSGDSGGTTTLPTDTSATASSTGAQSDTQDITQSDIDDEDTGSDDSIDADLQDAIEPFSNGSLFDESSVVTPSLTSARFKASTSRPQKLQSNRLTQAAATSAKFPYPGLFAIVWLWLILILLIILMLTGIHHFTERAASKVDRRSYQ